MRCLQIGLGLGVLGIVIGAMPAHASCGLDQCPLPGETAAPAPWQVSTTTRLTTVSEAAWYGEGFLSLQRQLGWGTAVGLILPWVHNAQGQSSVSGLGNIVAYTEWQGRPVGAEQAQGLHRRFGLQVEMPTAQDDALGDGHYLFMPYGGLSWLRGVWDLRGSLALGQTLGGGHHHHHHHHGHEGHDEPDEAESLAAVNPHSATELLLRGSVGYRVRSGAVLWRGGLGLDVVQELVEGQQTLAQGQLELQAQGPRLGFTLGADLPVSSARRWQGRGRIGLQLAF